MFLLRLNCIIPSDDCDYSYRLFDEYFDSVHMALRFFLLHGYKECGFTLFRGFRIVARSATYQGV